MLIQQPLTAQLKPNSHNRCQNLDEILDECHEYEVDISYHETSTDKTIIQTFPTRGFET